MPVDLARAEHFCAEWGALEQYGNEMIPMPQAVDAVLAACEEHAAPALAALRKIAESNIDDDFTELNLARLARDTLAQYETRAGLET